MNEAGTRERLIRPRLWGREVLCLRAIGGGNALCLTILTLLACYAPTQADSITVNGTKIEGVYVTEVGQSFYHIRYPADGREQDIDKSWVVPDSVVKSADRDALYEKWRQQHAANRVKEMERAAQEERAQKEREERERIQEEEARSAQEREDAERVAREQRIQAEEAERARIEKEQQEAAETEIAEQAERKQALFVWGIVLLFLTAIVAGTLGLYFHDRRLEHEERDKRKHDASASPSNTGATGDTSQGKASDQAKPPSTQSALEELHAAGPKHVSTPILSYDSSIWSPMMTICPACRNTVSQKASACPHCGHPISSTREPASGCDIFFAVLFAIIAAIVLLALGV